MRQPRVLRGIRCCLALIMAGLWVSAYGQPKPRQPDVEYIPTPQNVVDEMLRLAEVKKTDVVYDLGCGDGRVVITAAKDYGARGVGVDIDPKRIEESRDNARQAGVADRVKFVQQDLFETDIREASVVTLYLLPELNQKLRPKLLSDLRPGTRVVSHDFDMGDWQPDHLIHVEGIYEHSVYYWVIPANIDGEWRLRATTPTGEQSYRLQLQQQYQEIRGTFSTEGKATQITDASLMGDHLRFTVIASMRGDEVRMSFDGHVDGESMRGSMQVHGGAMAGRYNWTSQRDAVSTHHAPQRR